MGQYTMAPVGSTDSIAAEMKAMTRQDAMMLSVFAIFSLLLTQYADSAEVLKRECAIVVPKNVQLIHNILKPLSGIISVSLSCRSGACRGVIEFDGIEIHHFESTSTSPKELCALPLQTFDMASSGSECEGELKIMRFNIDKPGRYGPDFRGTSIQVRFSSSKGFSPGRCIPEESVQFDPGSIGISQVFDGSAARVTVSSF